MREAGDLARSQMACVTDDMMPFGNGPHVYPGRFLATDGMKMMLMNLVYRYEFKYPEGVTSRRENGKGHHTMLPCSTMPLLFKEKKAYGFS
jgi:cytochrome P450